MFGECVCVACFLSLFVHDCLHDRPKTWHKLEKYFLRERKRDEKRARTSYASQKIVSYVKGLFSNGIFASKKIWQDIKILLNIIFCFTAFTDELSSWENDIGGRKDEIALINLGYKKLMTKQYNFSFKFFF